jgi:hypothetical protein
VLCEALKQLPYFNIVEPVRPISGAWRSPEATIEDQNGAPDTILVKGQCV